MKYSLEMKDTIVALATPPGVGALAIVRLSGKQAVEIAARMVRQSEKLLQQPAQHMQLHDIILANGGLLDRGMVAIFREPYSYTGENVAEFYLHGSPYVISQMLELCYQQGARAAQPGEFTLRAFLQGKMDLTQAEAVADLIAASGEDAHRQALSQQAGRLSQRILSLREKLIEASSLIELQIDFSDQDLPLVNDQTLLATLKAAEDDLRLLAHSYQRGRLIREGATVAIAGPPNVGKSTLLNALIGEDRAIVDEQPGTTRDAVEALVNWEGISVRLLDTAGQGAHFTGADKQAVARAQKTTQSADVILWVHDLSAQVALELPPDVQDKRMILVGNKADLPIGINAEIADCLPVSALRGTGLERVKKAVLDRLFTGERNAPNEGILTQERHYEAAKNAGEGLRAARAALVNHRGEELVLEDIRAAIRHLDTIVGEVSTEEVLERIFANFCIGK